MGGARTHFVRGVKLVGGKLVRIRGLAWYVRLGWSAVFLEGAFSV